MERGALLRYSLLLAGQGYSCAAFALSPPLSRCQCVILREKECVCECLCASACLRLVTTSKSTRMRESQRRELQAMMKRKLREC